VADKGIKKATVKKSDLPAFNGKTNKYSVRYRIVSDDKNRYSQWSPYYSLSVDPTPPIECSVSVTNRVVDMVWASTGDQIIVSYDIYFKYGSTDWKYMETTLTNQYKTIIPESVSTLLVSLHRTTYPKVYSEGNDYFTSNPISV
jgi:hypothetical protein